MTFFYIAPNLTLLHKVLRAI